MATVKGIHLEKQSLTIVSAWSYDSIKEYGALSICGEAFRASVNMTPDEMVALAAQLIAASAEMKAALTANAKAA